MARAEPSATRSLPVSLIRARLAAAASRDGEAPVLLLRGRPAAEAVDVSLARATYLDAMAAAIYAGRLASPAAARSTWLASPRRPPPRPPAPA